MHRFELLLSNDSTTAEDWRRFVLTIGDHVKGLRPLSLIIHFDAGVVRYFVRSKHDLSPLSEGLEGFLLRPVAAADEQMSHAPSHTKKARFLKIPTGGNLLDLKELAKTLPPESQEDYARWWLTAERTLNDRFLVHLALPRYGDTANLWTRMVTRTLLLRHA